MTTIKCAACGTTAEKPAREINRQKRLGRTDFYCSRKCAWSKNKTNHLLKWARSEENKVHCRKISGNRKDEYTGFREYLKSAQIRTKHAEPSDLDLSYLKELWEKQEGKCVYTKVQLEHATWRRAAGKNKNYIASLDRIDSSRGYVKGNVQYISIACNWLKNNSPEEHLFEFFDIIRKS